MGNMILFAYKGDTLRVISLVWVGFSSNFGTD